MVEPVAGHGRGYKIRQALKVPSNVSENKISLIHDDGPEECKEEQKLKASFDLPFSEEESKPLDLSNYNEDTGFEMNCKEINTISEKTLPDTTKQSSETISKSNVGVGLTEPSISEEESKEVPLESIHGRGKLLVQISHSHIMNDSSANSAGRGNFLFKLAQQKKLLETKHNFSSESSSEFITSKMGVTNVPLIDPNNDYLERLSVMTHENPVIRKGEGGEKIDVLTNYIKLKTDPKKSIFEYEVTFQPEVDCVAYRFKLVNQHFKTNKGIRCYDGGTKLYLPDKITEDRYNIETLHPNDNTPLNIVVTFKHQKNLKECAQFYNILFNNCAKVLKLARLGREHYDYRQSHQIPQHKLEIWPGYVTSVKEFEGDILLCCDVKHRILRTETAYDVISNIALLNPDNVKSLVLRELLGQCVLTRYNNNLYTIDDIDWNKSPLSTFMLSSGEVITFLDYYKKQYNLKITQLKQPLLISKMKTKNKNGERQMLCLVPEICNMTGLTDKMRNDVRVMKEISLYTKVTPSQRNYAFKKFLENIQNNEHAKEMFREWGLNMDIEPLEIEARILPKESLVFRNKIKIQTPSNACWSTILKKEGALRSVDVKLWVLLHTAKDTFLANKFKEMLKKVGPGLGIKIEEPLMVSLMNDRIDTYILGLKENIKSNTQLVVCLCPTPRTDRYSAIKKFCCREVPVLSQVIQCSSLARENKMISVVQNVALQINNKLGGASWSIHVPLENCMVCGIDTYHEKFSNSVGGFVASLDGNYTKWFSRTCTQEPGQELMNGLILCFVAALKKYLSINKILPSRIFIFRDGVSDGMLQFVREHEIPQFLDACRLVSDDYKPKLSFIVVTKRLNTKYFISNPSREIVNPVTGTVVDHTITNRNFYDFFIVSQFVTCGTAKPSHYIVLHDENDLKPGHMQRLAYKFCHMYYNWPGTLRVPAPCMYAHKLAYLVGQNLRGPASEILEDKLYYL